MTSAEEEGRGRAPTPRTPDAVEDKDENVVVVVVVVGRVVVVVDDVVGRGDAWLLLVRCRLLAVAGDDAVGAEAAAAEIAALLAPVDLPMALEGGGWVNPAGRTVNDANRLPC